MFRLFFGLFLGIYIGIKLVDNKYKNKEGEL